MGVTYTRYVITYRPYLGAALWERQKTVILSFNPYRYTPADNAYLAEILCRYHLDGIDPDQITDITILDD